jgi:hypothetical protein
MCDQVRNILKAMYERKKEIENEKQHTSFKGKKIKTSIIFDFINIIHVL